MTNLIATQSQTTADQNSEITTAGMGSPAAWRLEIVTSAEQLSQHEVAWNDLWDRSFSKDPCGRYSLLDHWLRHFNQASELRCLILWHDTSMVAALPLVPIRVAKTIRAGSLPSNCWSRGGDLMVDVSADPVAVSRGLAAGVTGLPWKLLWLDDVDIQRPDWQALTEALGELRATSYHTRFEIAMIDAREPFETYQKTWSKSVRKRCGQRLRRLEKECGPASFRMEQPRTPSEVEPLLHLGFSIEDRSWKGKAGTSVLRSGRMWEFYLQQARLLAADGRMAMAFLEVAGAPIAFDYGWFGKGIFHSLKIGYDEQFSCYGPGHVLLHLQLEEFCRRDDVVAIDCMGPINVAMRHWKPRSYENGRLVVGCDAIGNLLTRVYRKYRVWRSKRGAATDVEISR